MPASGAFYFDPAFRFEPALARTLQPIAQTTRWSPPEDATDVIDSEAGNFLRHLA
jgi:hypothetical protein